MTKSSFINFSPFCLSLRLFWANTIVLTLLTIKRETIRGFLFRLTHNCPAISEEGILSMFTQTEYSINTYSDLRMQVKNQVILTLKLCIAIILLMGLPNYIIVFPVLTSKDIKLSAYVMHRKVHLF